MKKHLLLLHDGSNGTSSLLRCIATDWNVHPVVDPEQAVAIARTHPLRVGAVCLADRRNDAFLLRSRDTILSMPNVEWLALVNRCDTEDSSVRELIADRCFDFHTLPIDPQRLAITLGRAYGMSEIIHGQPLESMEAQRAGSEIVGNSPPILELLRVLDKIAAVDVPVLITGETGTGKELAARTIHLNSARANGPFVAVNCAALPESLVQSELFGHEKGAFTSADKAKIGLIESSDQGTILLDEIGDLSLDVQSTLLRFLQEKTIEHVGGTKSLKVDTRVIAATHVDLMKAVSTSQFREDLYHRLNVLRVKMPALRSCKADIEPLVHFFGTKFASEGNGRVQGFRQDTLAFMQNYHWPGNVRELMNCVRRALVMSEGRLIKTSDLGLERRKRDRGTATLEEVRADADRHAIICALEDAQYQVSLAADTLGVSRITLYRLLDKYGLRKKSTVATPNIASWQRKSTVSQ